MSTTKRPYISPHDALSYDPATGELRWKIRREGVKLGAIAGSLDALGYRTIGISGKVYKAHRLAWFIHHGAWPERGLDHINEVRDDNRLVNLRLATKGQNGANRGKTKSNKSGFKGVSQHKRSGRWQAEIRFGVTRLYLGLHDSPEEAHAAYCEAATRLHGEFANSGATQ